MCPKMSDTRMQMLQPWRLLNADPGLPLLISVGTQPTDKDLTSKATSVKFKGLSCIERPLGRQCAVRLRNGCQQECSMGLLSHPAGVGRRPCPSANSLRKAEKCVQNVLAIRRNRIWPQEPKGKRKKGKQKGQKGQSLLKGGKESRRVSLLGAPGTATRSKDATRSFQRLLAFVSENSGGARSLSANFTWCADILLETASNLIELASNLLEMASNLEAMASNLLEMASNLLAMASNLIELASNLLEMASNLLAMASNLIELASNLLAMASY